MQRLIATLLSAALLCGCATSVSFQSAVSSPNESKMPVTVKAALSMPKGSGPFPAVVLLHAAGGVRSHVSADWPAVLNAHGYAALIVDSCDSSNVQACIATRGQWMSRMWGDALGALDFLGAVPEINPDAIGVMGFSAGAFTVEVRLPRPAALAARIQAGSQDSASLFSLCPGHFQGHLGV